MRDVNQRDSLSNDQEIAGCASNAVKPVNVSNVYSATDLNPRKVLKQSYRDGGSGLVPFGVSGGNLRL